MDLSELMSPESQTLHLRVENARLAAQEAFRNTAGILARKQNVTSEEYIKFATETAIAIKAHLDKAVDLMEVTYKEKHDARNPRLPATLPRPS